MLLVKDSQEEEVGVTNVEKKGLGFPLLNEEYNEEVSARSFQEALMQWREERNVGGGQAKANDGMLKPIRPGKLYISTCCNTSFRKKQNKNKMVFLKKTNCSNFNYMLAPSLF